MKEINLGCHRIPERCFYYKGQRMPFCSRCLGCSIGHIISFVLFIFGILLPLWIAFLFALIMFIDWSIQQFFHIMSNNNRRLITGIMGGVGVGTFIWTILKICLGLVKNI